jgi:hypothetical protein
MSWLQEIALWTLAAIFLGIIVAWAQEHARRATTPRNRELSRLKYLLTIAEPEERKRIFALLDQMNLDHDEWASIFDGSHSQSVRSIATDRMVQLAEQRSRPLG